ncbi:hypothetical protein EJB05_44823, partial [Eragrostis curvula]
MGSSSALFFLFLLLLSAAADYAPARVRVGVILDIASVTGMRLQTSILMTVDDYYSAHPNSSTRIELHFRDSPGDAAGAVSAAEDLIRNAHVHAIIGPQTAAETEFVAAVGSRSRVPVLSFSATAPPMSPSGRPFLVRTCADDASLAAAVAGVMGKFAWRRAFLLHEDSPSGSAIVTALADAVQEVGASVVGFNQFIDVSGDSTSGTLKVTGYCIDVFDAVMKALPVSYRYVPFNGSSTSYDELVRLVAEQKADAVVGDVTITSSRMGEVDYTMPFTGSGWSMVVAVQRETSTSMFFFLKPLTPSLWFASFAFFVFTGFVVWAIEHRVNPEFRGTPAQQFGLIFYYAFSTLVFAHREKLESNLSRFVVIVWVFVVLILTSSYTASLTSMLTVQELRPAETDVAELVRRGDYVGYQEGSFVPGELKKMGFHEGKLRSYSTPDQYADALNKGSANGGVAAVFDEIPYLKLFLSQYCDGFAMAGPVYNDAGFGFVFPRGSPMVPDVSRGIVSLTESDDLALIERKWFGTPGACDGRSDSMGSSGSLSFWSFSGLFLVTGVASGLALVVYLATFVYRERDELRAAESGAGSVSLRRLRAWLQHYDRKDTRCRTFKHSDDDGSARNVIDAMQKQGAVTDEAMRKSCFSGSDDSAMAADSPTEEKVENEVRSPAIKRPMEEANAALATQGKPSLKFLMNGDETTE